MVRRAIQFARGQHIWLKYIFSGGTAAATQIGLLYVFTEFLGLWYIYSTIIAFIAGVTVSFLAQKFITFVDREMHTANRQLIQYLGIHAMNLVLNTFFLYLLVEAAGLWYIFAQVVVAGFLAMVSFFLYKLIVFKGSDHYVTEENGEKEFNNKLR